MIPPSEWRNPQKLREFFDALAMEKNFDPTKPANWYALQLNDVILSKKVLLV